MKYLDILYFAWVREATGIDGEQIAHPGAETTVGEVVTMLASRSAGHAVALGEPERLRAARDQRFVAMDMRIGAAQALALFTPVTGG